jgi:hypothetical protein
MSSKRSCARLLCSVVDILKSLGIKSKKKWCGAGFVNVCQKVAATQRRKCESLSPAILVGFALLLADSLRTHPSSFSLAINIY